MAARGARELGLVASLARPSGNLTGINFFTIELEAKRLGLLRELVPAATRIAVLVNPANPANAESMVRDVETAARAMDLQIQVLNASNGRELDAAFTSLARDRPTPSSSAPTNCSPSGVSNWSNWQHASRFPRHIRGVIIPRSAG